MDLRVPSRGYVCVLADKGNELHNIISGGNKALEFNEAIFIKTDIETLSLSVDSRMRVILFFVQIVHQSVTKKQVNKNVLNSSSQLRAKD